MFEKNNKRLIDEIRGSRDNRDSRDSRSSRDSSRRGYKSDSDSGLEVEMTLEVGLEVEEDQANPVLIATSPTMIFLTVTN